MMKKSLIYFLLLVAITVLLLNDKIECKSRRQDQFDEDEFSEFDSVEDDAADLKSNKKQQEAATSQQKNQQKSQESKNDFSSFDETIEDEDNNEDEHTQQKPKPKQNQQETSKKQKESSSHQAQNNEDLDTEEFEHFVDDEEFEGLDSPSSNSKSSKDQASTTSQSQAQKSKSQDQKSMPSLKIADVPIHLISNGNWQNYVYELVMIAVIFSYLIIFLYGKSKNYRLVNSWYHANRDLLERNFALVGDDGTSTEIPNQSQNEIGTLIKESENSYGLWCSGRTGCDGLLVQLKMIKRQDLVNGLLMQLMKPQSDQIIFSVEYPTRDEIDSFVFCLTNKKSSQQMFNDYQDLASYCTEKKTLPSTSGISSASYTDLLNTSVANKYVLLNEIGEVPNVVLDKSVCAFLNKYPEMVEYLLISDQYVGYRAQLNDEQSSSSPTTSSEAQTPAIASTNSIGLPKSRSVLIVCFNVPGKGLNTTSEDMESMLPALQLALYLIDKVPRIRLSKEAKLKAMKKRKDLSEQFMKVNHKQRQEAAMLRKEEKRRAEKDKIMNESDPEKQKRLEERELKKEKKKSLSKMKQVKIKSM